MQASANPASVRQTCDFGCPVTAATELWRLLVFSRFRVRILVEIYKDTAVPNRIVRNWPPSACISGFAFQSLFMVKSGMYG
jgi:hypothetical protein